MKSRIKDTSRITAVWARRISFFKLYLFFFSKDGDDKKRPVIIHRAILGSVERMIAILAENYGGKWYVAQMQF